MKRTEEYITREISRREETAIRKTPGSSIGGVSEEEKKKSSSAEDRGRALTFPPTTLLTIQFPNDPARPLKTSSQRPSSQARFSTKFIVLGLLGLGLLTSTVKGTPQIGTLQLYLCCHINPFYLSILLFKGFLFFGILNLDTQNTLKFIYF